MRKSSTLQPNFRKPSLSVPERRHSLLLAMAADLERHQEQAERLKQLRLQKERRIGKRISQETAAFEIGVSARTYRTWEGTGATIGFENLKAAAEYFDTTTAYIEYGQHEQEPTPDILRHSNASQLDRIEQKLDEVLAHLGVKSTQPAVRLAQGLLEAAQASAQDQSESPTKQPARGRRRPKAADAGA